MSLRIIAGSYSLAQAAVAGSTTFFSFADLLKKNTMRMPTAASLAAIFFILELINARCFQGQAILEDDEKRYATRDTVHTRTEISKQSLYLVFDTFKTFTNRYFLLASLDNNIIPLQQWFWPMLITDFILKKSFDLSNETYEATQAIVGADRRPFYHNKIACTQHSIFFKPYIIASSIEHVAGETAIQTLLILALYKINVSDIIENPAYLATSSAGALIVLILIAQTYLFEGKHTRENLAGDGRPYHINVCCKTPCKMLLNLMGPAHGLESGAGVYFSFNKAIANSHFNNTSKDSLKTLLMIASSLSFLATAIGTHYSEVKQAQRVLDEQHEALDDDLELGAPLNTNTGNNRSPRA